MDERRDPKRDGPLSSIVSVTSGNVRQILRSRLSTTVWGVLEGMRVRLMVVAMRRCRQALRAGDRELEGRDAAIRFFSGDQEAHRERPETDGFVRRIEVQVNGLLCHLCLRLVNGVTILVARTRLQPPNGVRLSCGA